MLDCGEPQHALELKLKEIELLESARKQFPRDGRPIADVGEAYTSVSSILHDIGKREESILYSHKAKNAFRSIFNSDQFPRFSYDSYSFVLWCLANNAKTTADRYTFLKESVKVLERAIENKVYVKKNKWRLEQTKTALAALKQQKYLPLSVSYVIN